MIFDETRPIEHRDALPERADVVVIGAGIAGICTAYYLAKAGVPVLVCEKGRVAGEQSSRNWGWIRKQGRDPDEVPLAIEANRLWGALADELDEDIGFTRGGVLYAAQDEWTLEEHAAWLEVGETYQLDTRLLTGAEVSELVRGGNDRWAGGLHTPSDARAEPFLAVPAIARAVRRHGGRIREHCAVRGLETSAGRVSAVVTEHGAVSTDTVVCAGGAWSSTFLANLGVDLPQLTVRGTVVRTAPAPDIHGGNALLVDLGIRRRQDGGYTLATTTVHDHFLGADSFRYFRNFMPAMRGSFGNIQVRLAGNLFERLKPRPRWSQDEESPFERARVLNPEPSPIALRDIRAGLDRWLPALSGVPFAQTWAGMIDTTPDVVPVLDGIESVPGLYVATGFCGHGFGIGPATGRIMADMVRNRPIGHDLDRFRFSRFSDGSPLRAGPGI